MRRIIIIVPLVLVLAGGALAGWHYLRPRNPLAEAHGLMAKGDLRAAVLVLRSGVQADPARAELHAELGRLQLQLGDPTAAEHELREALAHGWSEPALRPLLAQAVAAQGRNEEVLRDFNTDGLPPEQAANLLVARAQALLALGRAPEATAAVAEAERLAPNSLETALTAVRLALASGDKPAAEREVDKALAIDPHSLQALSLKAALQQADGDRPAALASYDAAIKQAQSSGAPGAGDMLRLGRARLLMATQDFDKARQDVDAVLQAQPKQPVAQFLSAQLYVRTQNWKAADAALETVGPVLPRLPQGELTLAVVKAKLNEPEQAIAAAQAQLGQTPGNILAVKLLAQLFMIDKQPADAAQVLQRAAQDGRPLDSEALQLLAAAQAGSGQPDQALDSLRKASALAPQDTALLSRLAAFEMRRGDPIEAEKALERVLDETGVTSGGNAATAPSENPAGNPSGSASGTPVVTPVSVQSPPSEVPQDKGPTAVQAAANLVVAAIQAGDVNRAAAALQRLKQAGGTPLQMATLTGAVKLAQVDLSGARAAFEEAIRLDPKAAAPRVDLARALALQGHTDEAASQLETVLKADPTNAPALASLVRIRMATGHPDQAVAAAESAQKAAPENPGLTIGLAELYLQTHQPQKALDLLNAPRKPQQPGQAGKPGQPGEPTPQAQQAVETAMVQLRAQAQLALEQPGAAAETLRPLLVQAPGDMALRARIAELLAADKKYDEARAMLRDGLSRRPGDPIMLAASVGVAQREGGVDAALARVAELARDPANAKIMAVLKGDLLVSDHRFPDAIAAYQAALTALPKDDPQAPAVTVRLAQAQAAAGDTAKATATLRDWLAAHPSSPEAALVLASFEIQANKLEEARTHLQTVLAAQPNNTVAVNNLAWVDQQLGDLGNARTLASRAYLLRPSAQTADTLGWVLLAQGQVADATSLLREAARGQPDDPAIRYHYAAALAQAGDKTQAVTLLKTLVDAQGPAFPEKPAASKLLSTLSP